MAKTLHSFCRLLLHHMSGGKQRWGRQPATDGRRRCTTDQRGGRRQAG